MMRSAYEPRTDDGLRGYMATNPEGWEGRRVCHGNIVEVREEEFEGAGHDVNDKDEAMT